MAKHRHYSPQLSRFVVSLLYHEAKRQKIPMTKLTDHLLLQSLCGSEAWHTAPEIRSTEDYKPSDASLTAQAS